MENASKALIIAASTIIAVLVLSVMIYLFTQASRVSRDYEYMKQDEMVAAYNAKFDGYAKKSDVWPNSGGDGFLSENIKYEPMTNNSQPTLEIQDPSNNFLEVISACNAAYDINTRNDNDQRNCVRVLIDIDSHLYCVVPNVDADGKGILKKDYVFDWGDISGDYNLVTDTTGLTDQISLYDLLKLPMNDGYYEEQTTLGDTNYVNCKRNVGYGSGTTISGMKYRYYFDGELHYDMDSKSPNCGKVNEIIFTLKRTEKSIYNNT